jgi:hypothetical protein
MLIPFVLLHDRFCMKTWVSTVMFVSMGCQQDGLMLEAMGCRQVGRRCCRWHVVITWRRCNNQRRTVLDILLFFSERKLALYGVYICRRARLLNFYYRGGMFLWRHDTWRLIPGVSTTTFKGGTPDRSCLGRLLICMRVEILVASYQNLV